MTHTWRVVLLMTVAVGVLAFTLGAGCSGNSAASAPPRTPAFDETRAFSDLEHQVALGYRVPGTAAHRTTRDWLVAQLKAAGAEVTLQPFSQPLGGRETQMWNIIAQVPGTGAAPRELVLLAAHWDSRPTADKDPDPARRATPIAGANDGASGVAVLLEVARQLQARPIDRDVTIVLFDGEDYGPEINNMLLGSKYYAKHLPERKPTWGILLDMIGDKDLAIYREPDSEARAKAVNDRVFSAARQLGYLRTAGQPGFVDAQFRYTITDDHTPINDAGIPMVDLIDFTYTPWHTTGDTVDKCSAASLKVVGNTLLYALEME